MKENLTISESTIEVRKFYNRFKLNVSTDFKEAPDNIVAEMEVHAFPLFDEEMMVISRRDNDRDLYTEAEKPFLEGRM